MGMLHINSTGLYTCSTSYCNSAWGYKPVNTPTSAKWDKVNSCVTTYMQHQYHIHPLGTSGSRGVSGN